MKTMLLAVGFLAALPLAAAAQATPEDLKKLAAAGVGDDVILAFVRSMGPAPKLSAGDIAELKKAGASDRVLQALIAAPSEPAPAPEAPVERAVERPVYAAPRTPSYETEPWYPVSYSFAPSYYYPSYYSSYGYPSYRSYYGSCYPGYGYGGGYYGGRYGWGVGIGLGYRWCR